MDHLKIVLGTDVNRVSYTDWDVGGAVTYYVVVAMLSGQVQRYLALVRLSVDRGSRLEQHLHGLRLALPGCIV